MKIYDGVIFNNVTKIDFYFDVKHGLEFKINFMDRGEELEVEHFSKKIHVDFLVDGDVSKGLVTVKIGNEKLFILNTEKRVNFLKKVSVFCKLDALTSKLKNRIVGAAKND